jgi:hypothetical protein
MKGRAHKKTTTKSQKKPAKKTTKKAVKKSSTPKKTSKRKPLQKTALTSKPKKTPRLQSKKPRSIKQTGKIDKLESQSVPHITPIKKPEPSFTNKPKKGGMNAFEQCIVLAAVINLQRNADNHFLFVPLPDVNSSALAPLRELLSQYDFTAPDIIKASHAMLHSKLFKECFSLHKDTKNILLTLKEENTKNIMRELIEIAGPEAKKFIYMPEKDSHDIHKTTLEKHALRMGLLEPHTVAPEQHYQQKIQHKRIIIQLGLRKSNERFIVNSQQFSGKQRRGRG